MGNHWGSGRDREFAGACAAVVRILAVTVFVAAACLFTAGFPWAAKHPGGAASGSVGSSTLGSGAGATGAPDPGGMTAAAVGADAANGLPGSIQTDARALVPFNRTLIRTVAKDGRHQLNLASAALKRPPEGSLMAPLEVLHPSSPFGLRVSPLSGSAGDFHLGQDFAAACGTRVYAADSGLVRAAGWHPWGGGNRVEIDHGNGLITTYNHLEAIAVHTGDSVQVGQVIARVGTTGWSTGCHLHFETILRGKHTDPTNWTFLPISQVDELSDIAMVSYAAITTDPSQAPHWAIPVAPDHSHTVLGGEHEFLQPPVPDQTIVPAAQQDADPGTPSWSSPTPTETSSASPFASPEDPTATGTATLPAEPPAPPATEPAAPDPSGTTTIPTAPGTATLPAEPPPPTATETAAPAPTQTTIVPVEPVPVAPAPVEPVPVAPVPVAPAPMPPAPVEPVPVAPAPADPVPVAPAPAEPVPVEPVPVAPAPVEPVPVEPVPTVPALAPPAAPSTTDTAAGTATVAGTATSGP
ncbi:murein DD-endopeptidase MepM/ murein hydrolase activator NlpD [Arthrobacter pascens]|nr:murein DD-endopeptidase MepM/ murein hydrolase activator NlpD [Arthrobacter pascens]